MGNNKQSVRRRNNLYKESPYCRQCGVWMVRPEEVPDYKPGVKKIIPDNMATLEHTVSRLQPDRVMFVRNRNTILCRKCNEENARKEVEQLSIKELRQRSGRG